MKNKSLLSIIALLLITALLLVSCDTTSTDNGKEGSEIPEQTTVNLTKDAVSEWAKYISFNANEPDTVYTSSKILSELKTEGSILGDIIEITDNEQIFVTPQDELLSDPVLTANKTTTKWYNVNTGAFVRSFESVSPIVNGNRVDESINISSIVLYSNSYDQRGIFEVVKAACSLKEAEPGVELDRYDVTNYDINYSYSYYFKDGSEFLKDLKAPIVFRAVNNSAAAAAGRFLADSEALDKTYLIEEGKAVIATFGYKMEYDLPVYDEDSINMGGMGYAYFEKGGNKYLITEEAPISKPVGEIYLVIVPGVTISITDANDKALAKYTSDCYGICGYAVLSNGNIYICEYELLNADAETYDIKSADQKLNINHKIINIANGSVTPLDLPFVASKLFNDSTADIRTFLNYCITMGVTDAGDIESALLGSLNVSDGYMLAEIQKHAEGELDSNTVFAVLNENFEVVAELPKIIANQFSYPSFIDEDTMVVSTRTAMNQMIHYAVEINDGEIFLYPDVLSVNVEPITGGYVWWKGSECKVYSNDWQLLRDFTKDFENSDDYNSDFRIINGILYYEYHSVGVDSETITVKKVNISYAPDYSANYEGDESNRPMIASLSVSDLLSNGEFSQYDGILVSGGNSGDKKYYNINANTLIETGEGKAYKSMYDEDAEINVHYDGDVSIDDFAQTEAGYLVRLRTDWTRSANASSPSDLPQSFTTYDYVVIK